MRIATEKIRKIIKAAGEIMLEAIILVIEETEVMKNESENFLDELLEEAEQKEEQQTEAYYDLVLLQIKTLSGMIEKNFQEADKECELIKNWALTKNAQTNEKIRLLELKLEAFIKEEGKKTIDLPNGTLKYHKKQDKVEIADLDLFLKKADTELLTIIPEQVKPNLTKIKSYIGVRPTPDGVKVIEGKEEFTYKLKGINNAGKKETGAGIKQTAELRAVV